MNDKMNEEVRVMEPEMPAAGTHYFTIETDETLGQFTIAEYINRNDWFDKMTWKTGNYFSTYNQVKKIVDIFNKKIKNTVIP